VEKNEDINDDVKVEDVEENIVVLTKEQLKEFDGKKNSKIYLAILGRVFDVSTGESHYAVGGSYAFFSAKDATRAYLTGDFTDKGLTDNLDELKEEEIDGLTQWIEFYQEQYKQVGVVVGSFYDEQGKPTKELKKIENVFAEQNIIKEKEREIEQFFPPCNSEYAPKIGHRVWCTDSSGGIERSWVGVPRKLNQEGAKSDKCVCVKTNGKPYDNPDAPTDNGDLSNPNLAEYPSCKPTSFECKLKK